MIGAFSHSAMATKSAQTTQSFFAAHILPALFVFLIPAFSAWFFPYAESRTDRDALAQIEREIARATDVSKTEKAEAMDFYRRVPLSRILASSDPKLARLQAEFAP